MKIPRLILLTLLLTCALSVPTEAAVPVYTDFSQLNTNADREKAYRSRTFRAYLPVEELSNRNKVAPYSRFENPTGIYFTAGENVSITLKGAPRSPVVLKINCFVEKSSGEIPLREGDNNFQAPCNGLAYVSYYDPQPETAPEVRMDIKGGKINGIFTPQDNNETWKRLVAQAPAQALDLMGERCQFIFDIAALRAGNPNRGQELLKLLDDLILWQHELLGWEKYNKHTGNHILGRAAHCGYMHQDGLGAAFSIHCTKGICNPDELAKSAWGISHEFGHAHQMHNDFCWVGMTEVTNNLFSSWANYRLNPTDTRLEHENSRNWSGSYMRGGRFDCYINNAIVNRQLWQLQNGPDSGDPDVIPTQGGDPFVTVAPLWQLQLYMAVARDKKDFYPDFFHNSATLNPKDMTHGMCRTMFMKRACDAAQLNLSEFFVKTGMLAPINRYMNDYSSRMLTVTDDMAEDVLTHASQYPEPDTSVIYYINANNVDIYRERRPVQPTPDFTPQLQNGYFIMPAEAWQNAVAFETYAGDKLIRISLRGLGQQDNRSTCVYCPEEATCVKAVQWDGQRIEVCHFRKQKDSNL